MPPPNLLKILTRPSTIHLPITNPIMDRTNLKRKASTTAPAPTAKKTRAITSFFAPTPAPTTSSSSSATPGFNKTKWIASLKPETRKLLTLEIESMHDTWLAALHKELVTDQFLALKTFLENEKGAVYPPKADIYAWTRLCPLNTVKVVILGQDPYRASLPTPHPPPPGGC